MSVAKVTFRQRLPGPESRQRICNQMETFLNPFVFKHIFRPLASSFCRNGVILFCSGGPKTFVWWPAKLQAMSVAKVTFQQRLPGPEDQDNEFATKLKRFWTPLFSNTSSDHLQVVSAEMVLIFFVRVDINFCLVGGRASCNVCSQSYLSTKASRPRRSR